MSLAALQLSTAFPHIARDRMVLSDATFAAPRLAWLSGPFWEYFTALRWNVMGADGKDARSWTRKNDCDNFARAYAQAAQDCHAISTGSGAEALAVGEFFYHSPRGPHAIVVAFCERPQPVFIEPQNNTVLALTPAEVASAFFIRF